MVISGPVKSEKTEKIEGFLDSVVDSGFKQDSNILVFRHHLDDPKPAQIGKHQVQVSDSVEEIYNRILPSTRTIIIAGASHFKDKNIINLSDVIVRSNRNLIVSGLNLDLNGMPPSLMLEFMALADDVILTKAICSYSSYPECREDANRSILQAENYLPVCTHHYHYDCPAPSFSGSLELFLGPMFSSKSTEWRKELKKVEKKGLDFAVFKWLADCRYGQEAGKTFETGHVTLHSGEKIPAINVNDVKDIHQYLAANPSKKNIFIDELQFFPGIYGLIFELLPKGYRFYGTGLPRGFNRKKFGEVADLMCLADKISMHYAICVECGNPATDNQRMKRLDEGSVIPAGFSDPLVLPGGAEETKKKYFYQARCLADWVLTSEPSLGYTLSKFKW